MAKLQRHLAFSNKEVKSYQHFAAGHCSGLIAHRPVQVQHIHFMILTVCIYVCIKKKYIYIYMYIYIYIALVLRCIYGHRKLVPSHS